MNVSVFGAPAVMPNADCSTYLIEQAGCGWGLCGHLSLHAPFVFPLGALSGTQVIESIQGDRNMELNAPLAMVQLGSPFVVSRYKYT
jgi:hypothetical protein